MGLRQWLSLVAAWTTERVFTAVLTLRDFVTPSPPALALEHVAAKIAVLTPINFFELPLRQNWIDRLCARGSRAARYQSFPRSTVLNKIEFNVLNPNLIVTARHRLMFDLDENVCRSDMTKSSQT
jgi:hypothetical protein